MKTTKVYFEKGQDLAEFAITSFFLLMVVFTIVDFGRGVYAYNAISSAVREGARYAIVLPDDVSGIRNRVHGSSIGVALEASEPEILFQDLDDSNNNSSTFDERYHDQVQICVDYKFYPVTPVVQALFGLNSSEYLNMENCAVMQMEY